MIKDFKNWVEVTQGIFRYVIAASACYEIHLEYHDLATDVLTAKASLYIVGTWNSPNSEVVEGYFERECLLAHNTVQECLEAASEDDAKNNEDVLTTVNTDTCEKVKAISPTIVVGGKLEKPYYSIIYYDISDNNWHQGYSSYNLEYVREWLSNCFEVIDRPVRPVKYGTWNDGTCSECGSEAIDGYTSNFCPNCGVYMSSNTEKL